MDDAIIKRKTIRQRGADAFDRGLSIDDHGMNPWVPAVADFRKGYQQRKADCAVDQLLAMAMVMEEVSPP